jgi:hypothetical protein
LPRKTVTERLARKHAALKMAEVEYRVLWDHDRRGWGVRRNGNPTEVTARKKLRSAIDCAIRDAKAELKTSGALIMVTCFHGWKLESMWLSAREGAIVEP